MRKPRVINRKEETNTNYQNWNPKGPGSCVEYQYTSNRKTVFATSVLSGTTTIFPPTLFFPVRSSQQPW